MKSKHNIIKKTRNKKGTFFSLPNDILLFLMLKISIRDTYSLQSISFYYYIQITQLFNTFNGTFWKRKAQQLYSSERLVDYTNYFFLVNQQLNLKPYMQKELDENKNRYISKNISGIVKGINNLLSVICEDNFDAYLDSPEKTDVYRFDKQFSNPEATTFSLIEISTLILNDDSEELFKKTARLYKMVGVFINDGLDIATVAHAINALLVINNKNSLYYEMYFLGLLPYIMRVRAVNCFDLFMRACLYYSLACDYELTPALDMIFACEDNYFKNHLANLLFRISPANHPKLFEVIAYYYNASSIKFIGNNLPKANSPITTSIFDYYKYTGKFSDLFKQLFPEAESRNELIVAQQEILNNYNVIFQNFANTHSTGNLTIQKLDIFNNLLTHQYEALKNNIRALEELTTKSAVEAQINDKQIFKGA